MTQDTIRRELEAIDDARAQLDLAHAAVERDDTVAAERHMRAAGQFADDSTRRLRDAMRRAVPASSRDAASLPLIGGAR